MIIKKFIKYLLIYTFSSFLISLKKFSHNFNEEILHLVFALVAGSGSFATSGSVTGSFVTSGSVAGSGVGSCVVILSKFFIGNNLLLKLLRAFSLALNNSPQLCKKFSTFFQNSLIQ